LFVAAHSVGGCGSYAEVCTKRAEERLLKFDASAF
jgi:hypothetical protein